MRNLKSSNAALQKTRATTAATAILAPTRMKHPKADPHAEIKSIYAELERRPLPRDCAMRTGCCHFRLAGHTPMLTRGEALFAALGVRASGRKALKPHPDGACPLLGRDGRCTIYTHRPFGCRTHFCAEAGGMYPRKHVADLIQRLEALDEQLGGDGSRPLEAAVSAALADR
jgi:Fe-S-cluster containining protein